MLGKCTSLSQGGKITLQSRTVGYPIVDCGRQFAELARLTRPRPQQTMG